MKRQIVTIGANPKQEDIDRLADLVVAGERHSFAFLSFLVSLRVLERILWGMMCIRRECDGMCGFCLALVQGTSHARRYKSFGIRGLELALACVAIVGTLLPLSGLCGHTEACVAYLCPWRPWFANHCAVRIYREALVP